MSPYALSLLPYDSYHASPVSGILPRDFLHPKYFRSTPFPVPKLHLPIMDGINNDRDAIIPFLGGTEAVG